MEEDRRQKLQGVESRSVETASEHPTVSGRFQKQYAQEMSYEVIEKHIALFVNEFSVSLGNEGRMAIEKLTQQGF